LIKSIQLQSRDGYKDKNMAGTLLEKMKKNRYNPLRVHENRLLKTQKNLYSRGFPGDWFNHT